MSSAFIAQNSHHNLDKLRAKSANNTIKIASLEHTLSCLGKAYYDDYVQQLGRLIKFDPKANADYNAIIAH